MKNAGNHAPKISVLLPTHNDGRYLESAIESVLGQDFADFEFIISDNASSDNSAAIIQACAAKDARIRYTIQPGNIGMVANWNWCLRQACGEYIKYLFGDDRLSSPHALSTLAGLLEAHPSAVLATSARALIDDKGKFITLWNFIKRNGLNQGDGVARLCLFCVENYIGEPTAVMFRASSAARGFDSSYRQLVDLEMWLHLLKQGNLAYTEESLCQFRQHAEQQTAANRDSRIRCDEHRRLNDAYLPGFMPKGAPLSHREKQHLFRAIHLLEQGEDISSATMELAPFLRLQLDPRWYKFFRPCHWVFRKVTRPFANARRAWFKYVLRDPSCGKPKTQA